jgi:hypothetical protein
LPILGTILFLILSTGLLLQSPMVQTFLTQKLAESLSRKYHTTFSIKGVSIQFFNRIVLEDLLVEDQKQDSMLFVHELVASIDSFSLKKSFIAIGHLKLNNTYVNISNDSKGIPNYQFLTDQFQSTDTLKTDSLNIEISMKQFEFNDARFRYAFSDSSGNHLVTLDDISIGVSDFEMTQKKLAMELTKFQLNDGKGLQLETFTGKLIATQDSVKLLNLHAKTANSEITEANILLDKSKLGADFNLNKLKGDLELKKSRISMVDIGQLVPMLRGMNENVEISGKISGTLVDLKGKDIELGLGNNTRLAFDFYLNGLPDIANTYMQFDLKQSFADFNDLSRIKLPDHFPLEQVRVPANLLKAGIIEYKGNFTGFLSDFVAYGTFGSKWGVLNTDLSFLPMGGKKLKIKGRIKTVNFQLNELAQTNLLDRITFNGDIQGILNPNTHNFQAEVSGRIDSMMVNEYKYKNIQLKGDILNKRFDGNLVVDDQNLKLRFDGEFDLNVAVPVFNFKMLVEKADLNALKLTKKYKESNISFALNANFTGNNIDNLAGLIHFSEGTYRNENGELPFDNIDLKTYYQDEPVLELRSDFLDVDIRGKYEIHKLGNTVNAILANYLPSAGFEIPEEKSTNNFDFRLELKDINRFTKVLIPDLRMEPAVITGNINSDKNTMVLNADFPQIQFQNNVLKKYAININADTKLNVRNKFDEISIGDQFKIYNLSLISAASGDILDSKLAWNNYGDVSYSGSVITSTKFTAQKNYPHVEISVKPSRFYLADDTWQINPASITIDSTRVKVNKLKFSNNSQSITADGSIDKSQDDKLNIFFDQIDLSTLNTFIPDDLQLKGILNGSLSLFDIYQRVLFLSDLKIDGLGILGQPMGNAGIQSRWDPLEEDIVAELSVESEKKNTLLAFGTYSPDRDSLAIETKWDHFSLLILQPLLGSSFANFHGTATGQVRITGPLNHIQHNGALYAENAGLMMSDLQVNYTLNDSVQFKGDKIIFPDIRIQDDYGNSGVFSGTIQHRSFAKMIYDLAIKSDRIMAFNTTPEISEQFYGKMFVSGIFRVTGHGDQILLTGTAKTSKDTEMNISLEYQEDAQQYDFLTFISHGYQPKTIIPEPYYSSSDFQMKFNVEVTPEAKAQLIYNSKIGDVIKAQGSGSMRVAIDNDYNVSLFGEYTFEQGDYLFTLQNVINKKFEIQQGGTIEWNGDPSDAVINLNALYRLKTSLSELFATNIDPSKDYTQRIPVVCKIALSKSLNNPDIKFDIELPTAEDRIKDEVKQFINSEEDMNKQILSLLVLGKFYTPEYLRGTGNYSGTNTSLAGSTASTASELVSNQLSNWLSQISNNVNIGVNYRPGNQITPDEMEFALSTLIFNDRVSINGNIGNNSSQKTTTNNNEIVGEADINVKLTNNGKLQLKAYNHSNNNLIYETSPYTQGVGLAYREDFNDFKELWQKVKSIFKRKTK